MMVGHGVVRAIEWDGDVWGLHTTFLKHGKYYSSIYCLKGFRGMGHMSRYLKSDSGQRETFLTIKDCGIESFLKGRVEFMTYGDHLEWDEYKMISIRHEQETSPLYFFVIRPFQCSIEVIDPHFAR